MGTLDGIAGFAQDMAAFGKGAMTGGGKALSSMVEGAVDTAKAGYALATDAEARAQTYETGKQVAGAVAGYADKALDDPAAALRAMKDKALDAYTAMEEFRATATPEQWGELAGGGAVELGLFLVPVTKVGKLGRVADEVADAARAVDRVEDVAAKGVRPCPKAAAVLTKTEMVGKNTATWTLDQRGRPIGVEATLGELGGGARSTAEKELQRAAGKIGVDGDEGGHLIGHRFMGDQGVKNLFPQNANLNRGAFKTMENEWADWIDSGREVKLDMKLHPPGSDRPDRIEASYRVIDPGTGKTVYKKQHVYANEADESFSRMSRADIQDW